MGSEKADAASEYLKDRAQGAQMAINEMYRRQSGEDMLIRDIQERDLDFVLRVNRENVEVLSPMDEEKLRFFMEQGELVKVLEVGAGQPTAFFIVLREGVSEYKSENYIWFSNKYEKFLYIDRIVIDAPYRRMGLGREIYEYVFEHAGETGVPVVTAEIDTIPYNEASLKFHEEMGFKEVGEQFIRGGSIKVSLQAVDNLTGK